MKWVVVIVLFEFRSYLLQKILSWYYTVQNTKLCSTFWRKFDGLLENIYLKVLALIQSRLYEPQEIYILNFHKLNFENFRAGN